MESIEWAKSGATLRLARSRVYVTTMLLRPCRKHTWAPCTVTAPAATVYEVRTAFPAARCRIFAVTCLNPARFSSAPSACRYCSSVILRGSGTTTTLMLLRNVPRSESFRTKNTADCLSATGAQPAGTWNRRPAFLTTAIR